MHEVDSDATTESEPKSDVEDLSTSEGSASTSRKRGRGRTATPRAKRRASGPLPYPSILMETLVQHPDVSAIFSQDTENLVLPLSYSDFLSRDERRALLKSYLDGVIRCVKGEKQEHVCLFIGPMVSPDMCTFNVYDGC